jgi:hypothetical protein
MANKEYTKHIEDHTRTLVNEAKRIKTNNKQLQDITRNMTLISDLCTNNTNGGIGDSEKFYDAIDKHVDKVIIKAIKIGRSHTMKAAGQFVKSIKSK